MPSGIGVLTTAMPSHVAVLGSALRGMPLKAVSENRLGARIGGTRANAQFEIKELWQILSPGASEFMEDRIYLISDERECISRRSLGGLY
ncbi:hypothetical protein B0J13DRAFT_618532 [Dactylonectria estremocensis]|uniref:Uncharacterized protein n=1 Tax=Dactylonectria estremocensis TaxID=1079267 RepID=A0A9P9F6V1_9HYPO|nr:hypothetical protein B0J13DRAFT_618532 [Dactylonectria estremocensis]